MRGETNVRTRTQHDSFDAACRFVVARAESDARFGGFDFRAAHAEADADLRELLDNTESLPFRRRGYERDGMLRTVVARAGFAQLYESAQQQRQQGQTGGSGADGLAAVPQAVAHFALDTLFERPVQAQVVELLLLPRADRRFTSCVLVHGMGGTGKVSGLTVLSFVHIDSDFFTA